MRVTFSELVHGLQFFCLRDFGGSPQKITPKNIMLTPDYKSLCIHGIPWVKMWGLKPLLEAIQAKSYEYRDMLLVII